MKEITIKTTIPEGYFCTVGFDGCRFFYWGDGGFDQYCLLFSNPPHKFEKLKADSFDDQGDKLLKYDRDKYRTRKCDKCIEEFEI
jgi:hypothetical protein